MNRYLRAANLLFEWNQVNLVRSSNLQKHELSKFFAPKFIVKANGREYEGTYDSYFDFLNQFRSTIEAISYSFGEEIVERRRMALPLKAQIKRTYGNSESYDAILILQFDESDKIILWQEVYVPS